MKHRNSRRYAIGLPGDNFSQALAVNASGQVVGFSTTVTPDGNTGTRAVLWTPTGQTDEARLPIYAPRNLGTLPGGSSSQALAVNASGQVVGSSTTVSSFGSRLSLVAWVPPSSPLDVPSIADGLIADGSTTDFHSLRPRGLMRR
jgi:probable HAF family extracellular repeat protein